MASPRTRKRKQQRTRVKAYLQHRAEDQAWWDSLTNQQKHDADYGRYRVTVLRHRHTDVLVDTLAKVYADALPSLLGSSALYDMLRRK